LWQNFGKIQSLERKFLRNYPCNIDAIFGATTLVLPLVNGILVTLNVNSDDVDNLKIPSLWTRGVVAQIQA